MNLNALPRGTHGRIETIAVDSGTRLRLSELGLRPGALVKVTHRAAFGGRVVAVGADRFAVDGKTCAQIDVSPADTQITSFVPVKDDIANYA